MAEAARLIRLPNQEALYPDLLTRFRQRDVNGELVAQYMVRRRVHERGPVWVYRTIEFLKDKIQRVSAAITLYRERTGQPPNLSMRLAYQSATYALALLQHLYGHSTDWVGMMAALYTQHANNPPEPSLFYWPPNDDPFWNEIVNVVEDDDAAHARA